LFDLVLRLITRFAILRAKRLGVVAELVNVPREFGISVGSGLERIGRNVSVRRVVSMTMMMTKMMVRAVAPCTSKSLRSQESELAGDAPMSAAGHDMAGDTRELSVMQNTDAIGQDTMLGDIELNNSVAMQQIIRPAILLRDLKIRVKYRGKITTN
jgi:hypothetical protein